MVNWKNFWISRELFIFGFESTSLRDLTWIWHYTFYLLSSTTLTFFHFQFPIPPRSASNIANSHPFCSIQLETCLWIFIQTGPGIGSVIEFKKSLAILFILCFRPTISLEENSMGAGFDAGFLSWFLPSHPENKKLFELFLVGLRIKWLLN